MNLLKVATPDSDFEQSFFQLAYEKLQEKLYNLLPYLVGFEIVNKSDDNTKALGVFGFKSNNGQVIYVPAFFVNGTVKGIDILYSKNNEQFYPLNEDFAELFLKDDATGIGDASNESEKQIMQQMQAIDVRDLIRPPRTGKVSYASVMDFVEEGDNMVKKAFMELFQKNDTFMESVLRFYPIEKVAKAVVAKKAPNESKQMPATKVVFPDSCSDCDEKTKEKVMSKGYAIIDNRSDDKKSKFGLVKYPETFSNPTDSGFYSYLTTNGSLNHGIIFVKPLRLNMHIANDDAIILDIGKGNSGLAYRAQIKDIHTRGKHVVKDYDKVHSMFTELAEAEPSFTEAYILVNERLVATQPFHILSNEKSEDGIRKVMIEPYDFHQVLGTSTSGRELKGNFYDKPDKIRRIELILTKRPGDTLEYKDGQIFIPKGFKLLHLNLRSFGSEGRPGGLAALNGALAENKTFPMAVKSNGSEYFVNVGTAKRKYKNAVSTKIALVTEFGLDEKTAEELVDAVPSMGKREGYVKLAYTGDYTPYPPDQQPYPNELGQPTYDGVGYSEIAPMDQQYQGDPTQIGLGTMPDISGQGPEQALGQAAQLAQAGQKQIFDTHSIATLAKYVSPASKVQGYMPDFISALDKLGRMLFLVYWETDKFEEMYGRGELPELVELLTNVFKNLGDLVIFLKRKSPEISINMEKDEISA